MKEFWNKLLSRFSSLFYDKGLTWSSTRFIFVFSAILSNLIILGAWLGLSIATGVLLPIDMSIIILYGVCNGSVLTTKLIQKNMEIKNKE